MIGIFSYIFSEMSKRVSILVKLCRHYFIYYFSLHQRLHTNHLVDDIIINTWWNKKNNKLNELETR
jgi:hypothetical protein